MVQAIGPIPSILDDLDDVNAPTPADGDGLVYEGATGKWINGAVGGGAGTVTDVTGTSPIVSSGGATPAISIDAATTLAAGSMSAADKVKVDALDTASTHPATDFESAGAAAGVQANLDAEAVTRQSEDSTLNSFIGGVDDDLNTHTALTTAAHGGIVASTDSRLSDARTPTAHATSHISTGSDAIPIAVAGGASGLLSGADKTKLDNTSGTNTGDQDISGKVDKNGAITGATKTKITYDTKGLVTAGADATTADIADSTNKRYVTDAELTVLTATSGVNTGDQTLSDATISTTDVTTNNVSSTKHGFAPKGDGSTTKFLNANGAYSTPDVTTDATLTTTDITTNDVSITKHGFAPKAPNDATKYLDGTGTYSVPAGGSFATPAIVLGTTAAAGSASTGIRSDSTVVAFDTTAPSTQAYSDAAAVGVAAVAARRDHKHGMPAAAGLYGAYLCYQDQKASGTGGGDFTSGAWRTRILNTEAADAGGHGTLSSNQITLDAGTYRCHVRCPAFAVNSHQTRLYNITDSATLLVGSSQIASPSGGSFAIGNDSIIAGRFTLATSKTVEVQHRCQTTQAFGTGFGVACSFGEIEVYTVAEFWKEN